MSRKYLGDSFDIHGGGKDLIFPHHENEIAQSEGFSGASFVHTWIHHGFVTIKDEKMSKSLGNFLTIRQVLEDYAPEALRLFVFSSHYRSPLDYSTEAMNDAVAGLDRLYNCLADIEQLAGTKGHNTPPVASEKETKKINSLVDRFIKAMDNDFNTAQGLGLLFDSVKTLNRIRQSLKTKPATADLQLLQKGSATLRELGNIMGILNQNALEYVTERQDAIIKEKSIDKQEIEALLRQRTEARQQKDWATADAIRSKLQDLNIEIKDDPEGTSWKVKLS